MPTFPAKGGPISPTMSGLAMLTTKMPGCGWLHPALLAEVPGNAGGTLGVVAAAEYAAAGISRRQGDQKPGSHGLFFFGSAPPGSAAECWLSTPSERDPIVRVAWRGVSLE
jgi:hypothetical protein